MTPIKGLPDLVSSLDSRLEILLPSETSNLVSASLQMMLPGIRATNNVSLINSLIELKDFGSLPRTLKRVRDVLPTVRRFFKKKQTIKDTLRTLTHTASDAYLQTQFNILPLLSDITAVMQSIKTFRRQLRELVSRANKPQKRFYKHTFGDPYVDKIEQTSCSLDTVNCVGARHLSGRTTTYLTRQFNATLEYSYTLPSWISEDSLAEALLDSLGVTLNPKIIWNAIPWSFVVDWVVNVNSWLDQFKNRNIEPIVYIRGFCWSVHLERYVSTYSGHDSADPCVQMYEDAYIRVVDPNALYSSFQTSGLNPKEFSLAAALAFSR